MTGLGPVATSLTSVRGVDFQRRFPRRPSLEHVVERDSVVSVPGARALVLADDQPAGPPDEAEAVWTLVQASYDFAAGR